MMFRVGFLRLNSLLILVLRNLSTRWVRTLLTVLGIVVGVAAMVAVNATNSSTIRSINRFFDEASGRSDLLVESAASGESFDEGALDVVRRFRAVAAAAPGLVAVTIPADEASDWDLQYGAGGAIVPGTNFWLLGRDPVADAQVHDYTLVDGRLLEPGETSYSLVLVDEYAEEKGVELGEDFAVMTPENGAVKLRLVGLIAKEGIGITNDGVIGIVPLNVVQELFGRSGQLDQIELVIAPDVAADPDALTELRKEIEARLGPDYDVKYPAARGELVADTLQSYQQGLNFFSVVSLFVGSFLIYNAFAMTVVERTREIGMLRAVGTTRGQIMGMVLGEALLLGVIGSVLGVLFGVLLARGLVVSVSGFTGQTIEQVSATPDSVLTAIMVGVTVTLASAWLPAFQASRTSPLKALRVQGNVDEGRWQILGLKFGPMTIVASLLVIYYVPLRQEVAYLVGTNAIFLLLIGATLCVPLLTGPIERLIRPLIILGFGNEGRLGSGNVNRASGRTTLTVAALMVGISMVVGINGLTTSFEKDIETWINSAVGGDLFVRSPLQMPADVEARLLALDEVAAATKSRFVASRLLLPSGEDEFTLFVAIDPETFPSVRSLRMQEGPDQEEVMRQLAGGSAILVSTDVANKHNLDVGDWVTLETRRGRRDFRVAAVTIDFAAGETTAVTGSWNDLRRYFGINDISTIAVKLKPGASLPVVTDKIENGIGRGLNLSVETRQEFEEKVLSLSAEAFTLFDVLGLIGLIVAALGVINTMLMNVLERTRELGGLRSLGMTRTQVQRMILAEATTIGVIGALFGVSFGAVLSDVFVVGLEAMGSFVLSSQVPYQGMINGFFVSLIVAMLSAWYPAVRASKVNIIEAIKHE
ncbi:MAG: ABC transporter permease [Anaerolineae bacterium]